MSQQLSGAVGSLHSERMFGMTYVYHVKSIDNTIKLLMGSLIRKRLPYDSLTCYLLIILVLYIIFLIFFFSHFWGLLCVNNKT